jgi:hypothetical protein
MPRRAVDQTSIPSNYRKLVRSAGPKSSGPPDQLGPPFLVGWQMTGKRGTHYDPGRRPARIDARCRRAKPYLTFSHKSPILPRSVSRSAQPLSPSINLPRWRPLIYRRSAKLPIRHPLWDRNALRKTENGHFSLASKRLRIDSSDRQFRANNAPAKLGRMRALSTRKKE